MNKIILSLIICLLTISCGSRYGDFYPMHDDGRAKPRVVLLPTVDAAERSSRNDYLLKKTRQQLRERGSLYLYPQEFVERHLDKMKKVSFFDPDFSFVKNFGGADVIVATELVEYRKDRYGEVEMKCMPPHLHNKYLLTMKLKVRIIDLRGEQPIVALQEIMTEQLLLPHAAWDSDKENYYFKKLSERLVRDLIIRLENVALHVL
ncbi:Uncharacterized protein NEOC65_000321 [Neochlamydia sp. AcF65]|uniref:DUF7499 family protein n=1 Tax=Neochlamydia sp. AcF65 TaxID=2795735 RepID=UPI001BC9DDA6|nr:hypothetical protein [Neochlamydia sp. AcF65]MBS4165268.1 Uncharacterized protein [Neochlamydia sp. AcF65]